MWYCAETSWFGLLVVVIWFLEEQGIAGFPNKME